MTAGCIKLQNLAAELPETEREREREREKFSSYILTKSMPHVCAGCSHPVPVLLRSPQYLSGNDLCRLGRRAIL